MGGAAPTEGVYGSLGSNTGSPSGTFQPFSTSNILGWLSNYFPQANGQSSGSVPQGVTLNPAFGSLPSPLSTAPSAGSLPLTVSGPVALPDLAITNPQPSSFGAPAPSPTPAPAQQSFAGPTGTQNVAPMLQALWGTSPSGSG